jgi:insulysin
MLSDIDIKIITNIGTEHVVKKDFLTSKHYKIKYSLTNHNCDLFTQKNKFDYKLSNIIMYPNLSIKNIHPTKINKQELPKLIYTDSIKKVYLLPINKYEKPILNISIVRQNYQFFDKHNNLIIGIFISICDKILNYYLQMMATYKMYYSSSITDQYLILIFNGLDYKMTEFINEINNKISYESISSNSSSKKYFYEIIHNIKEQLLNLKYNSPHALCLKYFSIILCNNFFPADAIAFVDSLTFESFMIHLNKLLIFEKEYFIIIGNVKHCSNASECDESINTFAMDYVNTLTLDSSRYNINAPKYDIPNINNKIYFTLDSTQINSKEVNNCLLDCYLVKQYKLKIHNNIIKFEQLKLIIKDQLIYNLITSLLSEPLFDKIRTIDKLGYIVRTTLKIHTYSEQMVLYLCYIIQSDYPISDIYKSVNIFNKKFFNDFNTNPDKFKVMFSSLKSSKILDLKREPTDINEEANIYLSSIINNYGIFTIVKLTLEILETITFDDFSYYVNKLFTIDVKEKRQWVILDKIY